MLCFSWRAWCSLVITIPSICSPPQPSPSAGEALPQADAAEQKLPELPQETAVKEKAESRETADAASSLKHSGGSESSGIAAAAGAVRQALLDSRDREEILAKPSAPDDAYRLEGSREPLIREDAGDYRLDRDRRLLEQMLREDMPQQRIVTPEQKTENAEESAEILGQCGAASFFHLNNFIERGILTVSRTAGKANRYIFAVTSEDHP